MGYRLHVCIPNVDGYREDVELGKQYESCWQPFNNKWFGEGQDSGLISYTEALEFYEELVDINSSLDETADYTLYNLEVLKEYVDEAIDNKYVLYFQSY